MEEKPWGVYVSTDNSTLFGVIPVSERIARGQAWGLFVPVDRPNNHQIGSIDPEKLASEYRRISYSDLSDISEEAKNVLQSRSET